MKMVKTRSGDVSPEDKLCINEARMPVKDTSDVKDEEDENDMTVSSQHHESSDEKDISYRPGYGRELRNRFVFGRRTQRVSRQGVRVSSRSRRNRFEGEVIMDVSQDELTDDDEEDNELFSPRDRRLRRKQSSYHLSARRLARSSRAHRAQVLTREEMNGRDSPEDKTPDNQEGEGVRRSTRNRKLTYDSFNTTWILGTQTLHGYPNMYGREKSEKALANVEDGGGDAHVHKRRLRVQDTVAYQVYMTDDDKEDEKRGEPEDEKIERGMKRTRASLTEVDTSGGMEGNGEMYKDMYSRVKRRRPIKRYLNSENAPNTRGIEDDPTETQSSPSSTDDESGNENEKVVRQAKYSLRKTKPAIDRYQVNNDPPRKSRCSRVLRSVFHNMGAMRRRPRCRSSSSSSSSSSSENRFERGQHKKTRTRCPPPPVPLNMDLKTLPVKKSGSNLADVDPMSLDRSIMFANVGGLHEHIRCLQEMVVFPMMYREVFDRFHMQPAKGVLFHGPPGTGKTLLARALANECSQGDRKVAFFMRKGADCLTKWVGESERQLRLLFEQAYQMRPSIIFFDEIDGLAPVRSSKQEQIHASIVSTLLALMDGLDSRGDVVVIGATNRIDAIDPALRRPGRFDRELFFPLPAQKERQEILRIHVSKWEAPPTPTLITTLAEQAAGYCGSDLRALCSEAVLQGLRRRYPQIYKSTQKLLLNPNAVKVETVDFLRAQSTIVPAAHRTTPSHGRKLPAVVEPLLKNKFDQAINILGASFPHGLSRSVESSKLLSVCQSVHRPHLLIVGANGGQGQTFLGRALLHFMEHVAVHTLDLETLFRTSSRTAEEACIQLFNEARRNLPSIIYVPSIGRLWALASETLRSVFLMKLEDIDPASPILLLATAESPHEELPLEVSSLFSPYRNEVLKLLMPTTAERRAFFSPLILEEAIRPPQPVKGNEDEEVLEVLPLAPPPSPIKLTEAELKLRNNQEEKTLRELRIFLRDCCSKLARNRLFFMFTKPVDTEIVPDYLNIIKQPMDLETMMTKIDLHCYSCAQDFLDDIDLVVRNALEYNPDRSGEDKLIRHRACCLRDRAYAMIKEEMDTDYEEQCKEIKKSRTQRAESPSRFVPDFIRTKPVLANSNADNTKANTNGSQLSHNTTALVESSQSSAKPSSSQSQDSLRKSVLPNGVRPLNRHWKLEAGHVRKRYRSRNSWQRGLIKSSKKRVVTPIRPVARKSNESAESQSPKAKDNDMDITEPLVNGIDSVDNVSSSQDGGMKSPVVLNRDDLGDVEFSPKISAKPKRSERSSRSSVHNISLDHLPEDSEPGKTSVDETLNPLPGLSCSLPASCQDKNVTPPNSKPQCHNSSPTTKAKHDVDNKTEKDVLMRVIFDQHALDQLLARAVRLTDGCNVNTLLDVHARLKKHIENCSQDLIKIELIDLLSKELDRFELVRRKNARCS